MKLTPENIAKIEAVLTDWENRSAKRQIAEAYGLGKSQKVSALVATLINLGVEITRIPPPSRYVPKGDRIIGAERQARIEEIRAMIIEGQNFHAIGRRYGISFQAVAQTAKNHNLGGGRDAYKDINAKRREQFREEYRKTRDLSITCKLFGWSKSYGKSLLGNEYPGTLENRRAALAPYVQRIRDGESFNSVGGGNRALTSRIVNECARLGVKSQFQSGFKIWRQKRAHENAERGL